MKRVQKKVRQSNTALADGSGQGSLCPFTVEVEQEDRSMFEVLFQDDRVSEELAVNFVMALLRTGIDSVSNIGQWVIRIMGRVGGKYFPYDVTASRLAA